MSVYLLTLIKNNTKLSKAISHIRKGKVDENYWEASYQILAKVDYYVSKASTSTNFLFLSSALALLLHPWLLCMSTKLIFL